jgi:mycothiol maleylpyruvate isomerase-like protein
MSDPIRERLSSEEAASWNVLVSELDRVPADRGETPGVGGGDWTVRDVVFHLAAWCDEAARQLAAVREGRYVEPEIDVDARNDEYLRAGRAIDVSAARDRLDRARERMLAEWSTMREPPTDAMEWFVESGDQHYREHLAELRALADAIDATERFLPGSGPPSH